MKRLLAPAFGVVFFAAAYAQAPSSILTVPTVANLPTTGANSYPVVDALGYYAAGDGGGGRFVLTTTGASADVCMAFTAVSGKKYIRQLSNNTLSLLQCGVKADYSGAKTENHAAIQAAFNAMSAYSLGEIYCPATADAIYFNTTITPVAGGTFRGQANTLNIALGGSGNAPGACHLVFHNTSGTGWAFDYQTAVANTCPSTPGIKFYNFTLEQDATSTGNGFRINNNSTAGYTDSCSAMAQGQNVVTGNVFDGIVTNSQQRSTTAIQINKAFDSDVKNSYFSFYDTQVDVSGSDNVLLWNNKFNFATVQAVQMLSHGTYGNFNTVRDNTFFSVYTNAPYFINTSARSGVIDGNYFEDDFGGNTAVFNVTCALAQTITNNAIETNSTATSYWLQVTGDCTDLRIDNNYNGGSLLPPAIFNSGAGSHWYANATKQIITGSGNPDSLVGIPFLTQERQPTTSQSAPAISGSILGTFDASSNQAILGNYAATIYVGPAGHTGDFEFDPLSAPAGHITFAFPAPVTGAVDIWVLAYTGGGSNQVLTVGDGVTTTTTTLTGGTTPTWYKVISNDTVTNPTIDTVNNDTVHGQLIYITRWQVVKH